MKAVNGIGNGQKNEKKTMTEKLCHNAIVSLPRVKARLLYIDFLRVISMLMVFYHHIRAELTAAKSWSPGILHLGWGTLGVYIFILLSGFSQYLTANDQLSYFQFLKKRLLKIMIPYWVYFFVLFIIRIVEGNIDYKSINYQHLAISLTSLDSYVNPFCIISYYCSTDWFMGFIVIMYMMTPFIFYLYKKYDAKLLIVFFLISTLILTQYHSPLVDRLPIVQFFTFLFGVVIADITYRRFSQLKISITFWGLFCSFVALYFIPGGTIYALWLRTACFSAFSVYFLKFAGEMLVSFDNSIVRKIIGFGAYISFMFFLCHHQILLYFNRYGARGPGWITDRPIVVVLCLFMFTVLIAWLLNSIAQFFVARSTLGVVKNNYAVSRCL